MYLIDYMAPAESTHVPGCAHDVADPVDQPAYHRREANRQESRRSYLALGKARSAEPDAELLALLSWSRVHGWTHA